MAKRTSTSSTCKNFLLTYSSMQAKYQFLSHFSTVDTKVLVITGEGYSTRNSLADTEVLDLMNPDMKCQNLAPFANGKSGATGALLANGSVVICGGSNAFSIPKECHSISKTNITPLTPLVTQRYFAASIAVNNTLWVLGGEGGEDSTEYVGMHMPSEPMPLALSRHTIIEIEENVYLLIGGKSSGKASSKTFIFNQNWTEGPSLSEARFGHASALITDKITKKKSVVVFGGHSGSQYLNSVEMLALPNLTQWQPGI